MGGIELRAVEALERIAAANEKLNALAEEERDDGDSLLGPPLCPHCGTLNPDIRNEAGGSGEMSEYVLIAGCVVCGKTFIGQPQGWLTYRTKEEYEGRNDNANSS